MISILGAFLLIGFCAHLQCANAEVGVQVWYKTCGISNGDSASVQLKVDFPSVPSFPLTNMVRAMTSVSELLILVVLTLFFIVAHLFMLYIL